MLMNDQNPWRGYEHPKESQLTQEQGNITEIAFFPFV